MSARPRNLFFVCLLALGGYSLGLLLGQPVSRIVGHVRGFRTSVSAASSQQVISAQSPQPQVGDMRTGTAAFLPDPSVAWQVFADKLRMLDGASELDHAKISRISPLLFALSPRDYPKALDLINHLKLRSINPNCPKSGYGS
jgi:hypothetical protein